MFNPELDEATATAVCVVINNHIESLREWERKLRQPFMPTTNKVSYIHRITPVYPKPTMSTVMHVAKCQATAELEILRIIEPFGKAERMKAEHGA